MLGKIYFYLKLTIVIDNNLMLPLSWNEICLECDCIYSRLMNMFHNTWLSRRISSWDLMEKNIYVGLSNWDKF